MYVCVYITSLSIVTNSYVAWFVLGGVSDPHIVSTTCEMCNRTSFRIYGYVCNLTYTVQIFLTFHVIAAKTTRLGCQAQLLKELAWPRSLASTACEGLATVHARVSSGTMIRPTIDELESAHREICTGAGK